MKSDRFNRRLKERDTVTYNPIWNASALNAQLALARTGWLIKSGTFSNKRIDMLLANAYLQGLHDGGCAVGELK